MLLEHVLDKPRAWLLAHDDACLGADQLARFNRLVAQRIQGVPMAYLVGVRAFMDFEVQVTPDVLIPRPETELLVQKCLDLVATQKAPVLLDLGTGSGVIAIALAKARPDAKVMAVDLSEPAIQLARANAARLDVSVQFLCGSWFAPFAAPNPNDFAATVYPNCASNCALNSAPNSAPRPPLKFDLIVSNPPYIHHQDPHLQQGDLRFEPRDALTDGDDGLSALRTIITQSKDWLKPGGSLWLEHGYDQGSDVRSLLESSGYFAVATDRDLAGHERISGGMLPA